MSILQFLRIIWAGRMLILSAVVACFTVAFLAVQIIPPRYQAQSRVMLDVIKPDPVTGQVMATAFLRAYTKTQIELVTDQQVARLVVEKLNWAKSPQQQKRFQERKDKGETDFTRWASQKVMDGAEANLIQGSNILEISYSSKSPTEAKAVADALREAYVEMTLQSRRETARRNADWYEQQSEKAKQILFQAEANKANFERTNGIVLQDDKVDIDTARLAALASQGAAPVITPAAASSPSAASLAQLEADIAEQSKVLGPNHPNLQQMKRRREVLAQQVAQERSASGAAASSALNAARATSGLLEAQKAKVMAQREKVERLRLMQDEINLRRDQYNRTLARAAELRQEAEIAEAGVVPLGNAITPQIPVFPQKAPIIIIAIAAGAAIGIALALVRELFGRRVRSAEDLSGVVDAPVLAVIRSPGKSREKVRGPRLWLPRRAAPGRVRTAQA